MLLAHLKDNFPDFLNTPPPIADLQAFYKAAKVRFDAEPEFKERSKREVVALQARPTRFPPFFCPVHCSALALARLALRKKKLPLLNARGGPCAWCRRQLNRNHYSFLSHHARRTRTHCHHRRVHMVHAS
mgnify:CR=1 FL=1